MGVTRYMAITEPHYRRATGKHSKNRGKLYRCRKNKVNDITKACIKHPAYRDPEGKERIFDTRWDLVEEGIFPANSDLSFEEMKEILLDSPCILRREKDMYKMQIRHTDKNNSLVLIFTWQGKAWYG